MNLHGFILKSTRLFSYLFILPLLMSVAACKGNTAEPTRQVVIGNVQVTVTSPTKTPYAFKTSEPGTISVHGFLIVLNPTSMLPGPDDEIYLVPMPTDAAISGVPQFEAGTVPQADVDERNGEFLFTDIQTGQYAVVVITTGGAQIPVRYQETGNYAIITLDASQVDTTVDLGDLTLP